MMAYHETLQDLIRPFWLNIAVMFQIIQTKCGWKHMSKLWSDAADGMVPLGGMTSAGTVIAKFGFGIYIYVGAWSVGNGKI